MSLTAMSEILGSSPALGIGRRAGRHVLRVTRGLRCGADDTHGLRANTIGRRRVLTVCDCRRRLRVGSPCCLTVHRNVRARYRGLTVRLAGYCRRDKLPSVGGIANVLVINGPAPTLHTTTDTLASGVYFVSFRRPNDNCSTISVSLTHVDGRVVSFCVGRNIGHVNFVNNRSRPNGTSVHRITFTRCNQLGRIMHRRSV